MVVIFNSGMDVKMYARPGGMSDDEIDDEGFSFANEDVKNDRKPLGSNSYQEGKHVFQQDNTDTFQNDFNNIHNGKHTFESHVVNACLTGHLGVVEEYLHTHNVNDFLQTGWTPLLYAASAAQTEIINYLLVHGADPNKHKDGYTPLMALCNSIKNTPDKCLSSLNLLIQAKANVNACNKLRETPLMLACQSKEPDFVSELLKHVNNIDACDNEGRSALMYAVIVNKPEVVQVLLENRADTTLKEKNDLSATDIAVLKGYDQILSLLSYEEKDKTPFIEETRLLEWKDMFPSLTNKNDFSVNYDVATILYGMGLETYYNCFQGINLKTFMQLTKQDLLRIGIDISVHREQFIQQLHKFHLKKWNVQSIGVPNKTKEYTIYDGVVTLGIVTKQISIIGSSFKYIKNSLHELSCANIYLTNEQKINYTNQVQLTQNVLREVKKEVLRIKNLAEKIEKETDLKVPACYIGRKKRKMNWPLILGTSVMLVMCISKKTYIYRIWQSIIS